jgi:hypothetical protein
VRLWCKFVCLDIRVTSRQFYINFVFFNWAVWNLSNFKTANLGAGGLIFAGAKWQKENVWAIRKLYGNRIFPGERKLKLTVFNKLKSRKTVDPRVKMITFQKSARQHLYITYCMSSNGSNINLVVKYIFSQNKKPWHKHLHECSLALLDLADSVIPLITNSDYPGPSCNACNNKMHCPINPPSSSSPRSTPTRRPDARCVTLSPSSPSPSVSHRSCYSSSR